MAVHFHKSPTTSVISVGFNTILECIRGFELTKNIFVVFCPSATRANRHKQGIETDLICKTDDIFG